MKYIIEIDDEPFGRNDDPVNPHGMDELYKATRFASLVFDKVGLSKLEPYNSITEQLERSCQVHSAKQFGVEQGWKAAAYIANKHGLPQDFFDKFDMYAVIEEMEENKKNKIGDEIEWKDDGEVFRGVLLDQIDFDGNWWLISENGCIEQIHESQFHKTGKKYTTVIDMVKELGEH